MHPNVVYFAHGKESGPWGTKIMAMAEVAKAKGFHVESPDYSAMQNAEDRVARLLSLKPSAQEHLVLVGSSMGGYVSAVASGILKPDGLFLLAPAFFRDGYKFQDPRPRADIVTIVHGWDDRVIPVDDVVRYAKKYKTRLYLVDSDHRLMNALPLIEQLFADFLEEVLKRS